MPAIGLGYSSTVFTANTTGTLVGVCGPNQAQAQSAALISGIVQGLTISADSSATTISIYDGVSTGGTLVHRVVTSATTTVSNLGELYIQCKVGIYIVISGGTTPCICLRYT